MQVQVAFCLCEVTLKVRREERSLAASKDSQEQESSDAVRAGRELRLPSEVRREAPSTIKARRRFSMAGTLRDLSVLLIPFASSILSLSAEFDGE